VCPGSRSSSCTAEPSRAAATGSKKRRNNSSNTLLNCFVESIFSRLTDWFRSTGDFIVIPSPCKQLPLLQSAMAVISANELAVSCRDVHGWMLLRLVVKKTQLIDCQSFLCRPFYKFISLLLRVVSSIADDRHTSNTKIDDVFNLVRHCCCIWWPASLCFVVVIQ
jgi:hypothetical protein